MVKHQTLTAVHVGLQYDAQIAATHIVDSLRVAIKKPEDWVWGFRGFTLSTRHTFVCQFACVSLSF